MDEWTVRENPAANAEPGWSEWIRQGFRAVTLRPVNVLPHGPGAWTMLLIVAAVAAIYCGASRFEVVGPASFDLRSWLFGWAPDAFLIFGAWLVLKWARSSTTHGSPVAAWYLLVTIAMVPISLAGIALGVLAMRGYMPQWWTDGSPFAWAIYAALLAWFVVTTWRITRAVTHSRLAVAGLVAYAFVILMLSSSQLQTQEWLADEPYFDDDGEFASLKLSQGVFESQQVLLQDALRKIADSAEGERELYGLVYAPYDQEVFLRESAMVQEVLEERFGARGRVVRLVNNSATAAELPWATTLNLERSLRALASAMDPGHDVLVVYLTSHGGADFKLSALNWPLDVEELTAEQLRSMLDAAGIRNRVIAISACYSGGWIGPLETADTLIMTAADKDHTSYGCGSKSELTFFGRALFDEQLRRTRSFEDAFMAAVPVIKQREIDEKKDDGFSNPQISVGTNIRAVLDELANR